MSKGFKVTVEVQLTIKNHAPKPVEKSGAKS